MSGVIILFTLKTIVCFPDLVDGSEARSAMPNNPLDGPWNVDSVYAATAKSAESRD